MTKRKPPNQHSSKTPRQRRAAAPDIDIIYGFHAVKAALSNPKRRLQKLLATQNAATSLQADGFATPLTAPSSIVSTSELSKYVPEGAVHQGIIGWFSPLPVIEITDLDPQSGPLVILDQITDPHNIGAIMRSATVFGAQAVITTDHHSPAQTGTLAKSASGAFERTPLIAVKNIARCMEQLKKMGFFIIGLAEGGRLLTDMIQPNTPYALVMGAEGRGMRRLTREHCDLIAEIPTSAPQTQTAEAATQHFTTLNVSNAAAVALFIAQQGRH